MEEEMRLKEADCPLDVQSSRLHIHNNVGQRDRNRNQPGGDKLPDSTVIHSTQWANHYDTSPNLSTTGKTLQLTYERSNFNNNITANLQHHQQHQREHRSSFSASSDVMSESSPDDSIGGDFEEAAHSSSSLDVSPQGDEYRCFSHEELSDSDSLSDDGNCRDISLVTGRGIVNPNYPGFQHLAHHLNSGSNTDDEDEEDEGNSARKTDSGNNNINNNNNNNNNNEDEELEVSDDVVESKIDSVNHLDSVENFQKAFYDKPKFNIPIDSEEDSSCGNEIIRSDSKNIDLNVQFSENITESCVVDESSKEVNEYVVNVVGDAENSCESCNVDLGAKSEERDEKEMSSVTVIMTGNSSPIKTKVIESAKLEDAFLSAVNEELHVKELEEMASINKCDVCHDVKGECDSNRTAEEWEIKREDAVMSIEKFSKEEQTSKEREKDEDSVIPRKKEKMEINCNVKKNRNSSYNSDNKENISSVTPAVAVLPQGNSIVRRRETHARGKDTVLANRRSLPVGKDRNRSTTEILGGFDVYNIETAMPKIDLDAIESHLRAAKEEERRFRVTIMMTEFWDPEDPFCEALMTSPMYGEVIKRRNDREEIRRRLAMGSDDDYYGGERAGRKPSLQARLQSGMNLQICFMNETVSDTESPNSDNETSCPPMKTDVEKPAVKQPNSLPVKKTPHLPVPPKGTRPSTSMLTLPLRKEPAFIPQPMTEADFFACQARLQAEARMALAQAKEMAHMQMEVERQRLKASPITEMVRLSLEKVGVLFPEDRRRLSRQILTEMNVAQLQVIVNDLHTQIEVLNESLVKFLMDRDDLHMEQDSMLVDIEDLTRYLGAKEQTSREQIPVVNQNNNVNNNNNIISITKPKINRIASLVVKK